MYTLLIIQLILLLVFRHKLTKGRNQNTDKKLIRKVYLWLWMPIILFLIALIVYAIINFLLGLSSSAGLNDDGSMVSQIRNIANTLLLIFGITSVSVLPIISWIVMYTSMRKLNLKNDKKIEMKTVTSTEKAKINISSKNSEYSKLSAKDKLNFIKLGYKHRNKIDFVTDEALHSLSNKQLMSYLKEGIEIKTKQNQLAELSENKNTENKKNLNTNTLDELKKLGELRDQKVLSNDEFKELKEKLLHK